MAKVNMVPKVDIGVRKPEPEPDAPNLAAFSLLPSIFDGAVEQVEDTGANTPYATYISTRSKLWATAAVQLPGLQEPDVVLVRPRPEPLLRLSPFRFVLLAAKQYWADVDEDGGLLAASLSKPAWGSDLREVIEACVLALHGGAVYPCRVTFKSTKCGCAKAAVGGLAAASHASWGDISAAHRATLSIPRPFLRFVVTSSVKQRTSRSSGYQYWQADGSVAPATPSDLVPLAAYYADPANVALLEAIRDAHSRRLAEVEAVAKRG